MPQEEHLSTSKEARLKIKQAEEQEQTCTGAKRETLVKAQRIPTRQLCEQLNVRSDDYKNLK